MGTRYTGIEGEMTACDFLKGIGGEILDTNVRMAGGEIDIVARMGGTVAFVEVKRRMNTLHGRPAEAVTRAKMAKIARAAMAYAAARGISDMPLRFDIIEILPGYVKHIPSAFTLSDIVG